jgi:hypothetical protein
MSVALTVFMRKYWIQSFKKNKESECFVTVPKGVFLLFFSFLFSNAIFSGTLEVQRLASLYVADKSAAGLNGPALYVVSEQQKFIDIEMMEEIGVKDVQRTEKEEDFPGFEADSVGEVHQKSSNAYGATFSQIVHQVRSLH